MEEQVEEGAQKKISKRKEINSAEDTLSKGKSLKEQKCSIEMNSFFNARLPCWN